MPSASVVVCVYTEKRWDDIVDAVASVAAQDVPALETLVVVDHNEALLERARRELTGVRVLANEHRQGLSGARNTAITVAAGDVVVFLDDDAAARPGWLRALLSPYEDATVKAVGGVAHPRWPITAGRPSVLPGSHPGDGDATGELDWIVGCTYTGQPTELAEVRNLMGCNMSFRREVFDRIGGFAEDIGRIGKNPLGCEETELCIRARQAYARAGEKIRILFEPQAVVDHRVSADRVEWAYLRRRSWAEGLSKAAVSKLVGSDAALATERDYVAKVLPAAVLRELRARRPASAVAVVAALGFTTAGYLRGKLPGATDGVHLPRPVAEGRREVTSFVHHRARLTEGQQAAWRTGWPERGRDVADVLAAGWDPRSWFGREAPVVLEIGSGMGESTAALAAAHPELDHVAVEVFEPGLAQLLMRLAAADLDNVALLRGDAVTLLREAVPEASLHGIRVFFPDPWPKRRHRKRRLVGPTFVALATSRLRPGGFLHLATDWADYATEMIAAVRSEQGLVGAAEGFTPRPAWRPVTKFEQRARDEGRDVRELLLRRR